MLLLLLLQAVEPLPDIQLNANVRARSVTIEKQGDAKLTVATTPEGGNLIDVRAPKANGRKKLRNVEVKITAEARIANPAKQGQINQGQAETSQPPSR